jgi:putative transposase
LPIIISKYHQGIMQGNRIRGQADLIPQDDQFYLLLVVDLPDKPLIEAEGVLDVDLRVKNIASDSMGGNFSGAELNGICHRYFRLRQKL